MVRGEQRQVHPGNRTQALVNFAQDVRDAFEGNAIGRVGRSCFYAASCAGGAVVPGRLSEEADMAASARFSHFSAWLSQVQLASGCSAACCLQIEPSAR